MSTFYPRVAVELKLLFIRETVDSRSHVIYVTPRQVQIFRNSALRADQCTIRLSYRDLPIDPRVVTAMHVAIFADDEGTDVPTPIASRRTLRFQGYATDFESRRRDADAAVILRCVDYTVLYTNRNWRTVTEFNVAGEGRRSFIALNTGETLEGFVNRIRAQVASPLPSSHGLSPLVFDDETIRAEPLNIRAGSDRLAMRKDDTAWDVLWKACQWFGHFPSFDYDPDFGVVLRIRNASDTRRERVSFRYGRDLSELTLKRRMLNAERKDIIVSAWSDRQGRLISGLYEGEASRDVPAVLEENRKTAEANERVVRPLQYVLTGEYTEPQLRDIARLVYEASAMGRLEGKLETPLMRDIDGTELLTLGNGDRVTVEIGPETDEGIEHLSAGEAVLELSSRFSLPSFDQQPARVTRNAIETAQAAVSGRDEAASRLSEFFIDNVTHTFDNERGYTCEVQFLEYLLDVAVRRQNRDAAQFAERQRRLDAGEDL